MRLSRDELTLQIGEHPAIHLTPNESAVLSLLMRTPDRTVPSERLLTHVWGDSSRSAQRMLKQLIYRLRQKIEADPATPRLIVTTPRTGYRLVVDMQPRDRSTASTLR